MTSTAGQPKDNMGTGMPGAPGPRSFPAWRFSGWQVDLTRPVIMGILNLTPDSFSDGGELTSVESALERARRLVREGARILDVGGESTRPGAETVPVEEELARVLPFIRRASAEGLGPISIDTRNALVAREALKAGAQVVNDVSGLNHDPDMAGAVAEGEAGLVVSHMRGTPSTMKDLAEYDDVTAEVVGELRRSLSTALLAGIPRERIVVDPGIGFAKTGAQSLRLLRELASLKALECPILVGPSRKSFIGELTGMAPGDRLPGTLAACVVAYCHGARVFRVHEVAPILQGLRVTEAILGSAEKA